MILGAIHLAPLQLGNEYGQRLGVAKVPRCASLDGARKVGGKHSTGWRSRPPGAPSPSAPVARAGPALAVKPDERATSAERLVQRHVWIHPISGVPDHHSIWGYACILEKSCSRSAFPGIRVCENGEVRREVRLADRAEHLPLVPGDVVPRPDLSERTDRIGLRLSDQRLSDLALTPFWRSRSDRRAEYIEKPAPVAIGSPDFIETCRRESMSRPMSACPPSTMHPMPSRLAIFISDMEPQILHGAASRPWRAHYPMLRRALCRSLLPQFRLLFQGLRAPPGSAPHRMSSPVHRWLPVWRRSQAIARAADPFDLGCSPLHEQHFAASYSIALPEEHGVQGWEGGQRLSDPSALHAPLPIGATTFRTSVFGSLHSGPQAGPKQSSGHASHFGPGFLPIRPRMAFRSC
jgi:hypothetical protein